MPLTDRQERFADLFVSGPPEVRFNATRSAEAAGYSWPDKQGSRLLAMLSIARVIEVRYILRYVVAGVAPDGQPACRLYAGRTRLHPALASLVYDGIPRCDRARRGRPTTPGTAERSGGSLLGFVRLGPGEFLPSDGLGQRGTTQVDGAPICIGLYQSA